MVHQDQNNYLGSCLPIILQVARLNSRDSFQQEFPKLAASKLAPDRSDLVGSSWNWSQCIPGRSVCSVLSFFVLTHSCHTPHTPTPLRKAVCFLCFISVLGSLLETPVTHTGNIHEGVCQLFLYVYVPQLLEMLFIQGRRASHLFLRPLVPHIKGSSPCWIVTS